MRYQSNIDGRFMAALLWQWIAFLLNDGFHQNRNRFRQSDRHAAGSDSICAALSPGLCQRAFLSAARNNGRAERPWRIVVLRARRERKSRAFMVDKGTPNLSAASLVG